MSIHTANRIDTLLAVAGLVGLGLKVRVRLGLVGLRLASQASRVYLCGMSIHTATGEASRVYSISYK